MRYNPESIRRVVAETAFRTKRLGCERELERRERLESQCQSGDQSEPVER